MIPVKYNIRNLRVRWVSTLMTVFATGLIVMISVVVFGMVEGLDRALRIAGNPLDLIVLRKGSTDEISSGLTLSMARQVASLPGISKDATGRPLCSVEFATVLTKPRRFNKGTVNLIIRGLDDVGRQLRPDFKIVQGRDIRPGTNEIITSRRMAARFENLSIGEKLSINQTDFEVVGYFEAGGSSAESEVWSDLRDIATARRNPEVATTVNLRAENPEALLALQKTLAEDERFLLQAVTETEFFNRQAEQSSIWKFIGYFIAGFLTFGAMFAAANTMYAAVASRGREIGTLRALGFSRFSVLSSFLLESVLLCLLGGILGCLAALPFNGLSTGTANFASFSEIVFSFQFGPKVLMQGVLLALIMGLLGGMLPAIRAVRLNIINALRER
jgi:putative ABC transport system permease protein